MSTLLVRVLPLRVSIVISNNGKHMLPVEETCAFSHGGGIGMRKEATTTRRQPCTFADGTHVTNHDELWRCMHEANCDASDDWVQMAIFRDPRPVVVSTFYHLEVHSNRQLGDLEGFVKRELPIVCQWLAVRYLLFTGYLADQSTEFWYNDAMVNPLDWHYHWFYSVGLHLPFHVVEAAVQAAGADDLGFHHKKVDLHPGEEVRTEPGARRFEDEVSPEIVAIADEVLRTWLPPILLERFGVTPG